MTSRIRKNNDGRAKMKRAHRFVCQNSKCAFLLFAPLDFCSIFSRTFFQQPQRSTMAAPPPEARPLPSPPTDGITALSFTQTPQSNVLASTSWDGCIRLHDVDAMSSLLCQSLESGPLLSLATPVDENVLLTGGMDGSGK